MHENTAPPTALLTKEYLPFLTQQKDIMCKIASKSRFKHYVLQGIIIICTAAITITLSINDVPKIIPIILSGIVLVATAFTEVFRFGEHSHELYVAAAMIDKESRLAAFNSGPYKDLDPDVTIRLLVNRVEDIIQEQTSHYASLGTFKPDKK